MLPGSQRSWSHKTLGTEVSVERWSLRRKDGRGPTSPSGCQSRPPCIGMTPTHFMIGWVTSITAAATPRLYDSNDDEVTMRMEEVWLIGFLAVTAPLLVVCAIGWWRTSRRVRALEAQQLNPSGQDTAAQRLEQVVEGLSSQLNELANSQDFLQRMLVNKAAERSASVPAPKAVTPSGGTRS